jgi:hypothetical protein
MRVDIEGSLAKYDIVLLFFLDNLFEKRVYSHSENQVSLRFWLLPPVFYTLFFLFVM